MPEPSSVTVLTALAVAPVRVAPFVVGSWDRKAWSAKVTVSRKFSAPS